MHKNPFLLTYRFILPNIPVKSDYTDFNGIKKEAAALRIDIRPCGSFSLPGLDI